MKRCITLFLLGMITSVSAAQASVMILDKGRFQCSDGAVYDVARHYTGGWGPGSWELVGFCSMGTLTEDFYNGRAMDITNSHPDLRRCADEETPQVWRCFEEFAELNGTRGTDLTPIIHAQTDQTSNSSETFENSERTDSRQRIDRRRSALQ